MRVLHFLSLAAVFSITASLGGKASAAWVRVTATDNLPVNLASNALAGTTVKSSEGIARAESAVSDNTADYLGIPKGESEIVLQLARQTVFESVSFVNRRVEGIVRVMGSADGREWTLLSTQTISGNNDVLTRFAGMQGKYVKLAFNTRSAGALRSLNISGTLQDSDVSIPPENAATGPVQVNYSSGIGRPIYAFPTPTNLNNPSAANVRQVLHFPPTNEKYLTVIYDLGDSRALNLFAAAYSLQPMRMSVYLFNQLPEQRDWRQKLTLDPAVLDSAKPVGIGEDPSGAGHIVIQLPEMKTARYVAMRFEPGYQLRTAQASNHSDPWSQLLARGFSKILGYLGFPDQGEARPVAAASSGSIYIVASASRNNNAATARGASNGNLTASVGAIPFTTFNSRSDDNNSQGGNARNSTPPAPAATSNAQTPRIATVTSRRPIGTTISITNPAGGTLSSTVTANDQTEVSGTEPVFIEEEYAANEVDEKLSLKPSLASKKKKPLPPRDDDDDDSDGGDRGHQGGPRGSRDDDDDDDGGHSNNHGNDHNDHHVPPITP